MTSIFRRAASGPQWSPCALPLLPKSMASPRTLSLRMDVRTGAPRHPRIGGGGRSQTPHASAAPWASVMARRRVQMPGGRRN
eukprot:3901359-Alexandrium_andersonii.AAC.1